MCRIIFTKLVNKFHIQRGKNHIYIIIYVRTHQRTNRRWQARKYTFQSISCDGVFFEHCSSRAYIHWAEFNDKIRQITHRTRKRALTLLQSTCLMRKFMQILKEKMRRNTSRRAGKRDGSHGCGYAIKRHHSVTKHNKTSPNEEVSA